MSEFKIGSGTTEDQLQQAFSYLFRQSSSGSATPGVLSGLSVTQTTTASADVLVNIGAALTQSSLTAGVDWLLNNAQKTLNVLTANPMGATPRNDLVVFDPADATIKLVVGTPNAIPTDPTPPAGSVLLARLRHAASATTVPTAKIDNLRTGTTVGGGPFAMAASRYSHTSNIVSGSSVGPFAQTFPAGRFTVAPNVTLGVTEGSRLVPYAVNITASGFDLYLRNVAASDSPAGVDVVHWQAVQMTSLSADG